MTSLLRSQLFWLSATVCGITSTSVGLTSLQSSGELRHDRNPLAIYGSPYGKLMARLSESTVDRVWHLGVEQIVPHNIDGSLAHAGMGPTVDIPITEEVLPQKPALEQLKDWFNGMRVVKYARTNPYSLSERHLAVVKKEVEEMLLESYKMDPSHYGAYNSYHLFLTTHDFGGTAKTREHAVNVANATLATVFQEDEDPEPWLTAASAAMNLYLLETEAHMVDGTDIPLETLKEYRSKIGYCLNRFEELQAQAEENGNWDNLSYDRQIEITHRHRFASRTFKQFDAMIARAEEPSSSAVPKSEVAGKASDED